MQIFISHISEEECIASAIKKWIRTSFSNCEVFISSDIYAGEEWRDEIRQALSESDAVLLICSPTSLRRPWIHFEAGGGWIRRLPVVPICHSGQSKGSLPLTISEFHAVEMEERYFPLSLIRALAKQDVHLQRSSLDSTNTLVRELCDAKERLKEKLVGTQDTETREIWDNKEIFEALEAASPTSTVRILQTWFPDMQEICPELERLLTEENKRFSLEVLLIVCWFSRNWNIGGCKLVG